MLSAVTDANGNYEIENLPADRFTVTALDDTLDLVTYLSGLTGIIGIDSSSLDGADVSASTENTFSGTILTFAGDGGSHVWKISLLAYY